MSRSTHPGSLHSRSKEEANDYRYFPDPDLLPVELDQAYIDAVKAQLPELPDEKAQRFVSQYQLSGYDAQVLTASRERIMHVPHLSTFQPRFPAWPSATRPSMPR